MSEADNPIKPGLKQLLGMRENGLKAPIAETLGFDMVEVGPGHVVFEGSPDSKVYNPLGSVHGGYAATLLDSACGVATHSLLDTNRAYTTLELKISYLRGLSDNSGTVRATGRIVSAGRRVVFAEAELHDGKGRLCATATSTLLLFDIEPATA